MLACKCMKCRRRIKTFNTIFDSVILSLCLFSSSQLSRYKLLLSCFINTMIFNFFYYIRTFPFCIDFMILFMTILYCNGIVATALNI